MENYTLDKDIHLVCVRARTFPDGIREAFEKLLETDKSFVNRTRYGISHGSKTGIVYRAAVEEGFKGEGYTFELDQYAIRKGVYATEKLRNITGNDTRIANAFEKLLKHPKLDQQGECVEWYQPGDEVLCMVRLTE
ncbi:MAG: transcriptional regulator [Cyclobacteriaceae bacterium]|nr:MAG: transcriptional regulator [Cyclobacteriaceae bacterium]